MGAEIKKHISAIPIAVVFGISEPKGADYIIENGLGDIAAVGKGLLCDKEWVLKAEKGEDVIKCLNCSKCLRYEGIEACVI
jgi:2,4-dienoyl-CoA reductase-like NADH-dependent reductase (Old Yellow Enzyme family)